MRFSLYALCLVTAASAALADPTPTDQLLVPPANADHFVVISKAGKHGDEWRWPLAEGKTAYRQSILLRGLAYEQDEVISFDAAGTPTKIQIRGVTPSGDSAERFTIDQGIARWKSPVDEGQDPSADGSAYYSFGGTYLAADALLPALHKAGAKGLGLLPLGRGTLEPARTLKVTGPQGVKNVRLHFLTGVYQSPQPIWLDDKGGFFASNFDVTVLPAGYEANLNALTAAQDAAIAELTPATAKRLLRPAARDPVLFRDVKLYDADAQRFRPHQDVLTERGKITQIGPAASVAAPANARIIDGSGKTLVPGLWDSHLHVIDDFVSLNEVAIGVTSVRNPGGSIDFAQSQTRRLKQGTLVAPETFTSIIIDRKGPLAAQVSLTVSSAAETLAAVRKIKAAGMTAVKFYTSMDPAWIPPAAKLAHKLGLHVHGHIPAGMRTLDAVNAGYDEITHVYFATMQAMPDEVVAKSNTMMRILGPAKYFKDVDFKAEPSRTVIRTLADKHIVVDPTLVVVENYLMAEPGKIAPSYTRFAGTLPPAMERSFKAGPMPLPQGTTPQAARASFKHMGEYVAAMRDAGVPIVAGTDGWGLELVHELELYVQGGMTPAQALATATIEPARNVRADKRTGSIAVGKEADLLLVDGDPETNIGDLRHVDKVVLDGALLDGDALRREAGFSGMPK